MGHLSLTYNIFHDNTGVGVSPYPNNGIYYWFATVTIINNNVCINNPFFYFYIFFFFKTSIVF